MTKFYLGTNNALAVVTQQHGQWQATLHLVGSEPQSIAIDPFNQQVVYCATFNQGVWQSNDAGTSWRPVGEGIAHQQAMSVAVSATERIRGAGIVYAGTEPTALFRSEDQGKTWRELTSLRQLPSAPTWSFPPRPYTSHVRWITPDLLVEGRVFVAIEAGALVRSFDGGQSWEDRKPDGPYDTHTLVMHHRAPDRLYSAAGDGFGRAGRGFVQSNDAGNTWHRPDTGLKHHYLWSVAADPANPDTVVISAAPGPQQAHAPVFAESALYRRSAESDWQLVQNGLPASKGMLASVVATNESEAGTFYAGNNKGLFRSNDAGSSWEELHIRWPEDAVIGHTNALVVVNE